MKKDETSSWGETEDQGYSPDKFYTGAYDDKNKCSSIRVNIPNDLYEDIKVMVAKDKIPEYRHPNDFYRDACVHLMHHRKEQFAGKANIFPNLDAVIFRDTLRQITVQEEVSEQALLELKDVIWKLARRGTTDNYQEDFGLLIERVKNLREPWQSEAREILMNVLNPSLAFAVEEELSGE